MARRPWPTNIHSSWRVVDLNIRVGDITKTHVSNGIGNVAVPIDIIDEKGKVVKADIITISVNYASSTPQDIAVDIKHAVDARYNEVIYEARQIEKMEVWDHIELKSEVEMLVGYVRKSLFSKIWSKIWSKITSIFKRV